MLIAYACLNLYNSNSDYFKSHTWLLKERLLNMNNSQDQTVKEFIEATTREKHTPRDSNYNAARKALIQNLGNELICDESLKSKIEKMVNDTCKSEIYRYYFCGAINNLMPEHAHMDRGARPLPETVFRDTHTYVGRPATLEESGLCVQYNYLEVMRGANASGAYSESKSHPQQR